MVAVGSGVVVVACGVVVVVSGVVVVVCVGSGGDASFGWDMIPLSSSEQAVDPPMSRNDSTVGVRGGPAEFKIEYQQNFQQTFKNSHRYLKIARKTCRTGYFLCTCCRLPKKVRFGSNRVRTGSGPSSIL